MTQQKCVKQKIGQLKRESLDFQGTIRLRFHLLLSFTSPIWEARHRHTQVTSFGMPPFQARDKDGTLYNQITSSDFKTPLSKLEVNPKKTDKTDAGIKELIKEHSIPHIDINDSYLEKLLCDHALSEIQNARGANTMKS